MDLAGCHANATCRVLLPRACGGVRGGGSIAGVGCLRVVGWRPRFGPPSGPAGKLPYSCYGLQCELCARAPPAVAGKCLLEWDGGESGDEPSPVPLLKDMFASERRKAKVRHAHTAAACHRGVATVTCCYCACSPGAHLLPHATCLPTTALNLSPHTTCLPTTAPNLSPHSTC